MQNLIEWLFGWLDETIEKNGEYGALKVFTVIGIVVVVVGVIIGMIFK